MMNNFLRKSNCPGLFLAGILFFLFASRAAWADYSGHVASFKSEKNAVVFVHEMKAKGLFAFYQKENIPGKGEFFRAYIGKYKTSALAKKSLAVLKKTGKIKSFSIRKMVEEDTYIEAREEIIAPKNELSRKAESKSKPVAQKSEPVQKPESKIETVAKIEEPVKKPEGEMKPAEQKSEPAQKPESKVETLAKAEPVQKPEVEIKSPEQKSESIQKSETNDKSGKQSNELVEKPDGKYEIVARKTETAAKPESKNEPVEQKEEQVRKEKSKSESIAPEAEPAKKPEGRIEPAVKKNEPVRKTEKNVEPAINKIKSVQKAESNESPSIDTSNYYKGIKGIVLKNGRTVKGKILSIDENDVLKIRTRSGRTLSYSFTRDVKEYITENEP